GAPAAAEGPGTGRPAGGPAAGRAGAGLRRPDAVAVRRRPPETAAVRLADLRPVQQLLARRLPAGLPVQRLAVHRPRLPLPEDPARLAIGEAGMAGRPLVVQQGRHEVRLVAAAVLVRSEPADCL